MGILLTRSDEENFHIAKKIEDLSLKLYFAPMISFEDVITSLDDIAHKHIIITSKHAAQLVSQFITTPKECWVVGQESAKILSENRYIQITGVAKNIKQLTGIIESVPTEDQTSFFADSIYLSGNIITEELPNFIIRKIIYNTIYSKHLTEEVINAISSNGIKYVMLYSKNSAYTLISLLKQHNILRYINSSVLIAISDSVAEIFEGVIDNRIYPAEPELEEMLQLLRKYETENS